MGELFVKDLKETIYYKISKSNRDIAKLCVEPYFFDYKENSIAYDDNKEYTDGLSFVSKEYALLCIPYGDQLTEFVFEKTSPFSTQIRNNVVKSRGSLGEYCTRKVFVGKNYSLSDFNTIDFLIKHASQDTIIKAISLENCPVCSISKHLHKLHFF